MNLAVTGGVLPYTYLWGTLQTQDTVIVYQAGVYYVIVTDALGCVKTDSVHLNQPTELQVSTIAHDATCAGASDGSIDLTVSGGTLSYSFAWSNDFGTTTFATTEDITNQPAGFYIVNVTDAHGCLSGTLDIINEPSPIVISSFTPTSGVAGNTVTISGSGFTPATAVSFNGTPASSFTINNDGEIIATVAMGTTTGPITVTALPGCSTTSTTNFVINSAVTLNVKVFIEGFYAGGNSMQSVLFNADNNYPDPTHCDTITIQLYDQLDPTILTYSTQTILYLNGNSSIALPSGVLGGSYYIVVKTRNGIETWSKLPVTIGANTSFDFTTP